jgi:hypothetical protein
MFQGFVLKLRHAFQLPQWRQAAEDPGEFRVARNLRLQKNAAFLWIEPAGDVLGDAIEGIISQLGWLCRYRHRVLVGNEEKALVIFEHFSPIQGSSEKIAQVETSRRLHTGENERTMIRNGRVHASFNEFLGKIARTK